MKSVRRGRRRPASFPVVGTATERGDRTRDVASSPTSRRASRRTNGHPRVRCTSVAPGDHHDRETTGARRDSGTRRTDRHRRGGVIHARAVRARVRRGRGRRRANRARVRFAARRSVHATGRVREVGAREGRRSSRRAKMVSPRATRRTQTHRDREAPETVQRTRARLRALRRTGFGGEGAARGAGSRFVDARGRTIRTRIRESRFVVASSTSTRRATSSRARARIARARGERERRRHRSVVRRRP